MSDRTSRGKIARWLSRLHWCAALLLVCATVFWLIEPATPAYLLMYAAVGVLWSLTVAWMWRMWSVIGNLAAMFVFAIGYLLPPKLFSVSSQIGELQGLLLAFSISAFSLWIFRARVICYARLSR
jgi:hypothetical protein